jgi:hypothetical protein
MAVIKKKAMTMELEITPKHRHFPAGLPDVNHRIHKFKIKYIVNFQFIPLNTKLNISLFHSFGD